MNNSALRKRYEDIYREQALLQGGLHLGGAVIPYGTKLPRKPRRERAPRGKYFTQKELDKIYEMEAESRLKSRQYGPKNVNGGGRKTKGVRYCIEDFVGPRGKERCKKYNKKGGELRRCVDERLDAEGLLRCHKYGSLIPRRRGGDALNRAAAARSPWIAFVRNYADKHRVLYSDALKMIGRNNPEYIAFKKAYY